MSDHLCVEMTTEFVALAKKNLRGAAWISEERPHFKSMYMKKLRGAPYKEGSLIPQGPAFYQSDRKAHLLNRPN